MAARERQVRTSIGAVYPWFITLALSYVGGNPERPPATPDKYHTLNICAFLANGKWYYAVRVNLFVCTPAPTYLVVVGEALGDLVAGLVPLRYIDDRTLVADP